MTSTEAASVLNGDRVFFTRDVDNSEALLDECTFDCFLKALLNRIREDDVRVQILVLVPTRELALQITEAMRKIAEPISVRVHACVGGTSVTVDKMVLLNGVHIIAGTPGRVKQLITLKSLVLNAVDLFVMYDFRRLLSKDMREALSSIITSLPEDIQKGKCVCTSSMPRAQRQLEQFCKEMSLCNFCDVSHDELLERDVPTPESGIDDGGEAVDDDGEAMDCEEPSEDEPDRANSFAHTRYIMAAIQRVNVESRNVQVLVIAPKIEEVKQISEELRESLAGMKILLHSCCEQTKLRDDGYVLKNGVHILIATPQRARDLLRREFLNTESIQVLVMVKAEELFCTGFKTLLHDIIRSMPENVQVGCAVPCSSYFHNGHPLIWS